MRPQSPSCQTLSNLAAHSQTQDFVQCYDEGYDDNYLCEGCSLVSSHGTAEITDGSLDSDCSCTCCFFQYVFNYCYRNYCGDVDEYSRARAYMSNVCSTAPLRTTIKPYIDSEQSEEEDHIQLFISNENSVYRTLENEEKELLFDRISESLQISDLRERYGYVYKRSEEDDTGDPDEDYEDYAYDEYDNEEEAQGATDFNTPKVDDIDEDIEEYVDDDEYPRTRYNESESQIPNSDDYEEEQQDHSVQFLNSRQEQTGADALRYWSTDPIDPDDYEDVTDLDDVDGIDPIDPSTFRKTVTKLHPGRLITRDISIERLEQVFKGDPAQAFGQVGELSFGQLKDVFDALQGDENLFLTGLKMYLSPESYGIFYSAYEQSYEKAEISKDEVELIKNQLQAECNQGYSSVLDLRVFSSNDEEPEPYGMGTLGCSVGYLVKLSKVLAKYAISGVMTCEQACILGTHVLKCADSFGQLNVPHQSSQWDALREYIGIVCESTNPNNHNTYTISYDSTLDAEEKIAEDISYFRHLEPLAASLDITRELAELESEYLWKSTVGSDPLEISAAIVLDKCEMEQHDLDDYMQLTLDSCDIRDLFYCKNHYKHKECAPDTYNATNPCNNACCLEIKMAQCAKTHCASKKDVNEFKIVANIVCSKYADASYMNGELPFPEATSTTTSEDEDHTSFLTTTSTKASPTDTSCDNEDEELLVVKRAVSSDLDIEFETQGGNEDDVKARVGESVCKLDEFSPGYDTSTCDKREVKDCIKEGIQYIKDDPEHFCPYCVNNNAYDECRCACCFGKYFSRVCYDPNCKDITEKLRYKRYVKDVCKTKPVTKFLFAREFDDDAPLLDGKLRFKTHTSKGKSSSQLISDDSIDIFAGFEDIHPDVDPAVLDLPTNPNIDLLDTMRKSSLRRPLKNGRVQKRDMLRTKAKGSDDDGHSLDSLVEKAHKQLGTSAKKYAKGSPFKRGSKSKMGRFSVHDRKKKPTGLRQSAEDSESYNGMAKRKKHRRVIGKSSKANPRGRKQSYSSEKYGSGRKKQHKIRVLSSNAEAKPHIERYRTPIAKRDIQQRLYRHDDGRPAHIGLAEVLYKRNEDHSVYIKGPEIQDAASLVVINLNSSETTVVSNFLEHDCLTSSKKYKTVTKTVTRTGTGDVSSPVTSKITCTTTLTATVDPITSTSEIASSESIVTPLSSSTPSVAPSTETPYATSTTTAVQTTTLTFIETVHSPSTTTVHQTTTLTFSETVHSPSTTTVLQTTTLTFSETVHSPSTTTVLQKTTIISNETVYTPSTTTVLQTTTLTSNETVFAPSTSTVLHSITTTSVTTTTTVSTATSTAHLIQITTSTVTPSHFIDATTTSVQTSIQTRYRKFTETETAYESVSTLTTTEWSDITTETSYKRTVYRYKDTLYETATEPTTVVVTSTREKIIPQTTITEIEESDKTVNITLTELDTTTETEYETAYRDTTVSTLTTWSGTDTTTAYKYTKIKYKKSIEVTATVTETETDDVILTRWYPVTTVTEYEETSTKVKYKWYPYTVTESSTETTTAVSTTTTTATTTTITTAAAVAARPIPSVAQNLGSLLSSLLGRRDLSDSDVEAYVRSQQELEFEDLDEEDVEYVIIEEIVEIIYPAEVLNYDTSPSKTVPTLNSSAVGDNSSVEANNTSNRTQQLFQWDAPSDSNGSSNWYESGTGKAILDRNVIYGSTLLICFAGIALLLLPNFEENQLAGRDAVGTGDIHEPEGDSSDDDHLE